MIFSQFLISPKVIIKNNYISIEREKILETPHSLSSPPTSNLSILIFFHVGTRGSRWYSQTEFMINALTLTGLLDEAKYAFLCVTGKPDRELKFNKKFKIIRMEDDSDLWEFPTIQTLYTYVQIEENFKVLYLHNKGATRTLDPKVRDWIDLMLYFTVYRWRETVNFLEQGYSIACVNWRIRPFPHCSGNFWWARSDYIRTLPYPHEKVLPIFLEARHNAEFWIGFKFRKSNRNDFCALHSTLIDHYYLEYPPEKYISNSSLVCLKRDKIYLDKVLKK